MNKILDCMWFGLVGIVRVNSNEEIKYYIKDVSGMSEQLDMQSIVDWGHSFPSDAGDVLFGIDNGNRK